MRILASLAVARYGLLAGALCSSMLCHSQQPDPSQSCAGDANPQSVQTPQSATAHTIKISWTESISPPNTVAGYLIYRREAGPKCDVQPNQCKILNAKKPVKGNSCTDYAVLAGHTYTYEAQTVGNNTRTSTFSNEATATAR